MEQKDSDNPLGEDEAGRSAGRIPVIKIKIPTRKAEEEEAEEARSHYCKDCKKSFASGKALGGHMSSAHVQANKDYSLKKLSSNSNSKRKSPDESICSICDRVFQSQKSLFGHMRCHPDREWRGMEPPPGMKLDDDALKLGFFNVKGWPTSKRGRAPKQEGEAEKEDELYMTAIEVLSSGKMERETASSWSPEKYKCSECGRVFSTHQALGGHRSSHNKFKISVVNTNDQIPDLKVSKKKKKMKNVEADFDLNVAPPQEDEDDEMQDSSNHTSSTS